MNIHRCHWQNHHNSAKTFAITKTGTKLLNRYKLKVKKNGAHSSKYFFKNLKNSIWACKIAPPPLPFPPFPSPPTQNRVKRITWFERSELCLEMYACVLKCTLCLYLYWMNKTSSNIYDAALFWAKSY